MMSCDRGGDQFAAWGFERRQRAHFIDAHQPAVADDIRSQNGRKPALGGLSFHERLPPASYSVRQRDYLPLAVERQPSAYCATVFSLRVSARLSICAPEYLRA